MTLKLTPSVADGYELYVNGENVTQDGGCTITLTGEQTSVSIALHAGDEITEYTLILCASDGCTVRIPVDSADIALQVFDQNGQAVAGSFNEKALIYVFLWFRVRRIPIRRPKIPITTQKAALPPRL